MRLLPWLSISFFWVSAMFLGFSVYLILHPVRHTGVLISRSANFSTAREDAATTVTEGQLFYHFGADFMVTCWQRVIPPGEWFPSLYKISQVKPWAHGFCYMSVIFGGIFRFLAALHVAANKLKVCSKNPDHKMMTWIFILNETLLNISLLGAYYGLLNQYSEIPLLPVLTLLLLTFFIKMISSLWHSGYRPVTVLRLCLLTIAAFPAISNLTNFKGYISHRSCDIMTSPARALCEWLGVFAMFSADVIDVCQCVTGLVTREKKKNLYMEIMENRFKKTPLGLHVITVNE